MSSHDPAWFHSAVVYQIYPRSFQDSNGDGMGDLSGILSRVDHLADLGVDVVWLSPVYASPQADNGYDIADYRAVDPVFGMLEDLDALIAALHERGMKLVMDLVVNHTSDQHAWFQESRSSRDDPRRDWYHWRPPRPGYEPGTAHAEPNNWGGVFSGPAWAYDETTGEYYLHIFAPQQPDLNWENSEVRVAVYEMMNFWLDRGVDGFRMDVINFISKVEGLPDADFPIDPATGEPFTLETVPPGIYGDGSPLFQNGPRIHEFLQEMHREVFRHRDGQFLAVGEMPGATVEEARLYTDPARGEVDMVFQFEHVDLDHGPGGKFDPQPLDLRRLKNSFGHWQKGLAEVGWNSLYWNNHDQPRIVSRWGDDSPEHRVASAKALGGLLHLHRGTPYVYQGEELGMTNGHFASVDDYRDLEVLNHVRESVEVRGEDPDQVFAGLGPLNRDNARTPVQWEPGPTGGFTTGTPWIGVTPNTDEINAASQRDDPHSVLSFYRELIRLRHELAVIAEGSFTMLLPEHETVYAFTRRLDDDVLVVIANLASESSHVEVAVPEDASLLLSNLVPAGAPAPDRTVGTLEPWELQVWRAVARG